MSSLWQSLGFTGFGAKDTEDMALPVAFPFPIAESAFIEADIENTYARILTDVLERTHGIPEKKQNVLWDNCVASEKSEGLVSLLSKAMYSKGELFLIYDSATNIVRKAEAKEATQIKKDYEANATSATGVYITFKNFKKTDMLKIYSALEYCAVASLFKGMHVTKAIQIKINDLRASVAVKDSDKAKVQAQAIAQAMKEGKDFMIDAKDVIELATIDLSSTNAAMTFINEKRSLYLGLPLTWVTGASSKGLGDSGEGDARAIERGLTTYYFSIIKPVIEALLGVTTTFESEDFRLLGTALNALTTFDATSDEHLNAENKTGIINKLFGLPKGTKGTVPAKVEPVPVPALPPAKV